MVAVSCHAMQPQLQPATCSPVDYISLFRRDDNDPKALPYDAGPIWKLQPTADLFYAGARHVSSG